MTESSLKELLARAARLANLRNNGPHILRHTFCSHPLSRMCRKSPSGRRIESFPNQTAVLAAQIHIGERKLSMTLRHQG